MTSSTEVLIRPFQPADADMLRQVFYQSVHFGTTREYTEQQRNVWAPLDYDKAQWQTHMVTLNPFVIEYQQQIIGYADLQPSGLIDHFYILPQFHRQGFGKNAMEHIFKHARTQNIPYLFSFVSLTAQPFFLKMKFQVEKVQQIDCGGVLLTNARMGYYLDIM